MSLQLELDPRGYGANVGADQAPEEEERIVDLDTLYAKATFYVRPEHTLVLCTVGRRVGGPGSALWGDGWRLDRGGRSLADVALQDVPWTLMQHFVIGDDLRQMSAPQRAAWMRTWQGPGVIR